MSAPPNESGRHQELAPSVLAPAAVALPQVQTPLQPKASTPPVAAAAAGGVPLQRIQNGATRALAEAMYQLRRIGMAPPAGLPPGVAGGTPFIPPNPPPAPP